MPRVDDLMVNNLFKFLSDHQDQGH